MSQTPIFYVRRVEVHLVFLARGNRINLQYFESEISAMQPEGARLHEIKFYELAIPEDQLQEFVTAITANPPHSAKRIKSLNRIAKLAALMLGLTPLPKNIKTDINEPRVGYVKTVIVGIRPDVKDKEGKEMI